MLSQTHSPGKDAITKEACVTRLLQAAAQNACKTNLERQKCIQQIPAAPLSQQCQSAPDELASATVNQVHRSVLAANQHAAIQSGHRAFIHKVCNAHGHPLHRSTHKREPGQLVGHKVMFSQQSAESMLNTSHSAEQHDGRHV